MKTLTTVVAALSIAVIISSCGPNENLKAYEEKLKKSNDSMEAARKAPKVATPITWADMKKENNFKTISIDGYLTLPKQLYFANGTIQINFTEKPDQKDGFKITCNLPVGTGNNTTAALKDSYTTEDFKVTTDKGKTVAGEGLHVKITGELSIQSDFDKYTQISNITKIEKLD